MDHVGFVVDGFVGALDHEALVAWGQLKVGRRITQTQAVVEAAFVAVASYDDVGVSGIDQLGQRHDRNVLIGRAALVGLFDRVGVAEPSPGDEVGIGVLEVLKERSTRQQHEAVLLHVGPSSTTVASGEQAVQRLLHQIAAWSLANQGVEHDGIGATIGVQQHPFLLAVAGSKGGRIRCFGHPVVQQLIDLGVEFGAGQGWPQPACDIEFDVITRVVEQVRCLSHVTSTGRVAHV